MEEQSGNTLDINIGLPHACAHMCSYTCEHEYTYTQTHERKGESTLPGFLN